MHAEHADGSVRFIGQLDQKQVLDQQICEVLANDDIIENTVALRCWTHS